LVPISNALDRSASKVLKVPCGMVVGVKAAPKPPECTPVEKLA
jgi:hypothetical protein